MSHTTRQRSMEEDIHMISHLTQMLTALSEQRQLLPCSCAAWRCPSWPWPWRCPERRRRGSWSRCPRWTAAHRWGPGLAVCAPSAAPEMGRQRRHHSPATDTCGGPLCKQNRTPSQSQLLYVAGELVTGFCCCCCWLCFIQLYVLFALQISYNVTQCTPQPWNNNGYDPCLQCMRMYTCCSLWMGESNRDTWKDGLMDRWWYAQTNSSGLSLSPVMMPTFMPKPTHLASPVSTMMPTFSPVYMMIPTFMPNPTHLASPVSTVMPIFSPVSIIIMPTFMRKPTHLASPVSTMMPTFMRSFCSIRWWCTAPIASKDLVDDRYTWKIIRLMENNLPQVLRPNNYAYLYFRFRLTVLP